MVCSYLHGSTAACMTKVVLTKLKEQLPVIVHTCDWDFEIWLIDVQHQSGSSDFSLFVVAFVHAGSMCWARSPTDHIQAEEHAGASIFSICGWRALALHRDRGDWGEVTRKQKATAFSCRLPWNKKDNVRGPLLSCHICYEWFHWDCEHIPDIVFDCMAMLQVQLSLFLIY